MDTFEVLTKAGLTKKEAATYTALLERGELSLSEISTETHIHRPALYMLIPSLQKKGLVSTTRKGRRIYYRAESPARILASYTDDHEDIASRLSLLSEQYRNTSSERPIIKFFEGFRGVTFIYDDVIHTLPRGGTLYRYSAHTGKTDVFKNTYYMRTKAAKQIERLVITSEKKAKQKPKILERSVKAIPLSEDLFEDNVSLLIYGNKTAYVDYNSHTAFIIESPKIARFQEKLFKLLYKKL